MPKQTYNAPDFATAMQTPPADATPEVSIRRPGRPRVTSPKYARPGYSSFSYYLDSIMMANVRALLSVKKVRGTNPTGVSDVAELVGFLVAEWYEREKNTP